MMQLISDYPVVFVVAFSVASVLMTLLAMVGLWIGGRKTESAFEGLNQEGLKFREKGVSGYSKKSVFTRLGGARQVLEVMVTDTEFCIKGIFGIFTYLGTKYDLTRRVSLGEITQITQDGSKIEISFAKDHDVVLRLKDPKGLIRAIKG